MTSPPFTKLPSFISTAILLSYIVVKGDAESFLELLSKNASKYYAKHKEILDSFLGESLELQEYKWLPSLPSGDDPVDFSWPSYDKL